MVDITKQDALIELKKKLDSERNLISQSEGTLVALEKQLEDLKSKLEEKGTSLDDAPDKIKLLEQEAQELYSYIMETLDDIKKTRIGVDN